MRCQEGLLRCQEGLPNLSRDQLVLFRGETDDQRDPEGATQRERNEHPRLSRNPLRVSGSQSFSSQLIG